MIEKKLKQLRSLLRKNNYDGYILSTNDEYLSEYAPAHAKRVEYLTEFTGSNALVLVVSDSVLFFTDGRYLEQAATQLDKSIFQIFDQKKLVNFPWQEYISITEKITYDPKIFVRNYLKILSNIRLEQSQDNFIDKIWNNQPAKPSSIIYDYSLKFAGEDYKNKIKQCREFIKHNKAKSLVITNPESVCWLLNVRAHDIEFSPILLAHAIVTLDRIYLFIDVNRYDNKGKQDITILPEEDFSNIIHQLDQKIIFDPNLCSDYITTIIEQREYQHLNNPCIGWKSQKNSTELEYIKKNHIDDAVAVCEILAFISNEDISSLSEYDVGKKLTNLRKKSSSYVMDSFPTICGFKENGAIIHYRAEKESAKRIMGDGLLLIDSGGQYIGATTDITRTIPIGLINQKHKEYYTNVLKGHISLAKAVFPEGQTIGANLDILARQFLWKNGKDYVHGTGHGVGSFLSVHEGPQNISLRGNAIIKEGMVISNEPGYYVPKEFGIRIENMMYVKKSEHQDFLAFEALTLVPYSKELIIIDMLTQEELLYIKKYYNKIRNLIKPSLSEHASFWLEQQLTLI